MSTFLPHLHASLILARVLLVLGTLTSACQHVGATQQRDQTRILTPDAAGTPHGLALALAEAPTRSTLPEPLPRIVVSELFVDPLLLDDNAGEFIEIVNLSNAAVRLVDLELALPSGKVAVPERPGRPVLGPGEVVLLTPLGKGPGEAKVRGMRLPNQAGRLELRWRGRLLDVVQWHKKRPWPKQKPGFAIERVAPDANGGVGGSWRHAREAMRVIERATPGRLTWPCEPLRDTAVWSACMQARKQAPKTRNRAHECTRSDVQKSLRGDLNPRPNDYESFALTT